MQVTLNSTPEAPRKADDIRSFLLEVGAGNREAFASLYNASSGQVFHQIRKILVDPSQAEEVTQEVFLEIWQTAARYESGRGQAMPWMLTIARRRAIDRVRASQSSRDRDYRTGIRQIEDDYDSVSLEAEIRSESARVRRAMADLTIPQRQAIELLYFEELSLAEISAQLLVPAGTLKTRIRDGILRLRINIHTTA